MKHILAVPVFMLYIGIAYAGHVNVTLDDLLLLAESRVSDKTILTFIETREIAFTVSEEEIVKLRESGLSEEAIQYLLAKSKEAGEISDQYKPPPVSFYPYSQPLVKSTETDEIIVRDKPPAVLFYPYPRYY